jgi:hypothetical protein
MGCISPLLAAPQPLKQTIVDPSSSGVDMSGPSRTSVHGRDLPSGQLRATDPRLDGSTHDSKLASDARDSQDPVKPVKCESLERILGVA